jgi:pimeloyl-ACP methyl ester carboxylesterase
MRKIPSSLVCSLWGTMTNDAHHRAIPNSGVTISIPVAVSVFPDELYPAPRSWAEKAFPKLIHFNKVEKGCHFAAWEQPKIFSEEVRAGFRSLR